MLCHNLERHLWLSIMLLESSAMFLIFYDTGRSPILVGLNKQGTPTEGKAQYS